MKYLAIRERAKKKKVVIEHVSTELMLADPFIKGLPPSRFKDLIGIMSLISVMQFVYCMYNI